MAIFFAEAYLSRDRAADLRSITNRLRDAQPVRHLFSYFVADDETVFHCLQGASPEDVRIALDRTGVVADRIVRAEAIPSLPRRFGREPDQPSVASSARRRR